MYIYLHTHMNHGHDSKRLNDPEKNSHNNPSCGKKMTALETNRKLIL